MKNFYFLLVAILELWVEYCSHKFFGEFLLFSFLQKTRLVSTVNCMRCSYIRLWCTEGAVST